MKYSFPYLFIHNETYSLLQNLADEEFVPLQFDPNSKEIELVERAANTAVFATIGSSLLLLLSQVFLGGTIKMLWGMLNTMQLVSYLPLLSLHTPPLMKIFFTRINFINSKYFKISDFVYENYKCTRVY